MPAEAVTAPQTCAMPWDRLGLNDKFPFRCGPELDCFTHCCRDVTIVLTPYDVLRMKQSLGMDSTEFLDKHTLTPAFPSQKFPLVILKMDEETKRCPFVSERGCGVYRDRPWSCRLYPLGTAEPKNPSPEEGAFHFVVIEDLCHGHTGGTLRSVREWIDGQGVEEFEMMGASFKDLTLHDFWDRDQELTPEQADMFYMACYDWIASAGSSSRRGSWNCSRWTKPASRRCAPMTKNFWSSPSSGCASACFGNAR